VGKGVQLGAVFAEVSSARMEISRVLTPLSSIRSQRLSSVLPKSHSRFVLSTGGSEAEVITLDRSALEGTKQIRSNAIKFVGSVAARLTFGGQGRRRNRQRGDRYLGSNNAANVQSNAKDCQILMRVRQAWAIQ